MDSQTKFRISTGNMIIVCFLWYIRFPLLTTRNMIWVNSLEVIMVFIIIFEFMILKLFLKRITIINNNN